VASLPGAGAAGAIGAGLYACCNAELCLGTDLLFPKIRLEQQIQWADLVITSEGKLDAQTFYGKAPGTVLQLARKYKKPVLFICGQLDKKNIHPDLLPEKIITLADVAKNTEAAQRYAVKYLRQVCQDI
jgi:glycerate kinase